MKWKCGETARVVNNHPWNGRIVTISMIISGSVVRVTDRDNDTTIINLNNLRKPIEWR